MVEAPFHVGQVLTGPLFTEPMRLETVASTGEASWVLGLVGTRSGLLTLNASDLAVRYPSLNRDGARPLIRLTAWKTAN